MKILFPLGSFYPAQSGGPNNTIYWLAEALTQNNLEVYVITTDLDIQESHNIELNKWKLSSCGNVIYLKSLIHYFPLRLLIETIKTLKKIDIIHLTGIFYPPSLLIYLVNRIFYQKPVVWSIRGELAKEALIYGTKLKSFYLGLIRLVIQQKLYFHTTSKDESELVMIQFQTKKIVELPNYIKPNPKLARKEKTPYLLFIGRISPKKAIENLLYALNASNLFENSGMKMIIAGDHKNKYGKQLNEICQNLNLNNRVDFIGHVEKVEKDNLYANAFFTLMPSHNENFGNVVVESLSQGTPVIASTGAPWKILQEFNCGYWISNSPEKIARAIDRALQLTIDEYSIMRKNAYKLLQNEFDINYKVGDWISFYKNFIEVEK